MWAEEGVRDKRQESGPHLPLRLLAVERQDTHCWPHGTSQTWLVPLSLGHNLTLAKKMPAHKTKSSGKEV